MKKRIVVASFALALVGALSFGVFAGCGGSGKGTIAVVAKGDTHSFWQSVKKGAEKAGKEFDYKITFAGPPNESAESLPTQREQVTSAVSNANALVFGAIGKGYTDLLKQAKKKDLPVVELDSGIYQADKDELTTETNPIVSAVATNNESAAAIAGEKFFEILKTDIAAKSAENQYVVGIIQHDETTTGVDRAKGFQDRFAELVAADTTTAGKVNFIKEVKSGDANNAYQTALESLNEKGANAIFMTNEGVVNQVYAKVTAANDGEYGNIKFFGFDAGKSQYTWMTSTNSTVKGAKLYGSVAQDAVEMGYQAVCQAIYSLTKDSKLQSNVAIKASFWDNTNAAQLKADGIVYDD